LAELAERFQAMLLVDEAHATGVFGAGGCGVCEHPEAESRVHVRVGTLSKTLGSLGGFVAGQARLIDGLAHRARTYVFSTAAPEALAAAGLRALQIVRDEPQRRTVLLERAAQFRRRLQAGWNTGDSASQIVPVFIGGPERTMRLAAALRERGFLVPGIRPPSVPRGESLLRISLSYGHTEDMLEQLAAAFDELRAE
jgi:8-amino-7-oxononanoate synthase